MTKGGSLKRKETIKENLGTSERKNKHGKQTYG